MTELRRRMLEEPGLRNYSGHTIEVYLCCVAKFAQKTGFRRIGSGRSISANISYSWSRRKGLVGVVQSNGVRPAFFLSQVLHRD